jgi:hypothetical protein
VTQEQNVNFEKLETLAKKEKCLFVQIETFFLPINPQNMPSPPTPLPKGEGSSEIPLLTREGLGENFTL